MLHWQKTLTSLLEKYRLHRPRMIIFFPVLYIFFALVNDACYWWAMVTAFPELVFGYPIKYYSKVQYPVALLGALFDSLSFFVTIYIIEKASKSVKVKDFIGHLSIDLIIAILATFWVLFVFSLSSWIMHLYFEEVQNEPLTERQAHYAQRVTDAVKEPTKNLRNIYFGLIMGVSAMFPTLIHIGLALRSLILTKINKSKTAV